MFSKKYDYRQDNPGVHENIERIRQRMIANILPAHAQLGPAASTLDPDITERGDPAPMALEWQKYDTADHDLIAATSACLQIAENNLQAEQRRGAWASLSNAVRRSMKWYTSPSERYWQSLTAGLDHVVASLKAHDAVLQIHAEAIRGSQNEYSDLVGQLQGLRTGMATPSSPESNRSSEPGPERESNGRRP